MAVEQELAVLSDYSKRKKELFQNAYFRILKDSRTEECHPIHSRRPGASSYTLSFSYAPYTDIKLTANSHTLVGEKTHWLGHIMQHIKIELGENAKFSDNSEPSNPIKLEGEEALTMIEERIEEFLPPVQMLQEP